MPREDMDLPGGWTLLRSHGRGNAARWVLVCVLDGRLTPIREWTSRPDRKEVLTLINQEARSR